MIQTGDLLECPECGMSSRDLKWHTDDCIRGQLQKSEARITELERVLRIYPEWFQDEFTGVTGGRCLLCGGYKMNIALHPGEFAGHAPGCPRLKALGEPTPLLNPDVPGAG